MQIALEQHVKANPDVRGGKPCIAGTRITVSDVVLMHLHLGQSIEQIAGHYDISLAALHAAMAYYYDHQAEIDQAMQDEDATLHAIRQATPSLLQTKLRTLNGG
jgi:uncharacterized protein (DUF433 family)